MAGAGVHWVIDRLVGGSDGSGGSGGSGDSDMTNFWAGFWALGLSAGEISTGRLASFN